MKELAELELKKVAKKARQMFTRKEFRQPTPERRAYKAPVRADQLSYACQDCGRPKSHGAGRRCRECYQNIVRANHAAKVLAEHERVSAAEAAFKTVVKREEVMAKAKKASTPILRSTSGLRETIFQEMEALRSGESTWQRARSMAMLANTVLDSVKTEVEYHKYAAAAPKVVESEDNVKRLGTDIALVQQAA